MFTIRKKVRCTIFSYQYREDGANRSREYLEKLSQSLEPREVIDETSEYIVWRVLRTLFGVGQPELKNLVDTTVHLVVWILSTKEVEIFKSVNHPHGLIWEGAHSDTMRTILLSKINEIQYLDALIWDEVKLSLAS